jgi:hypothetical protein
MIRREAKERDLPHARPSLARVAFAAAIAEKPAGRFPIRTRVVKRHPERDF